MKALWVLNSPIGSSAMVLGYSMASSGTWVSSAESILKERIDNLCVDYAVMGYQTRRVMNSDLSSATYELAVKKKRGHRARIKDQVLWKNVIEESHPDLIHIWGTEFSNFLDVMDVAGDIPCIVTLQGMVGAIAIYSKTDIPVKTMLKGQGLIAVPAYIRALQKSGDIVKQVRYEKEILSRASAVLIDNEWAAAFCRSVAYGVNCCYFPLPINHAFSKRKWSAASCKRNTVFTIAPSTPMKGLHKLVEALDVVKKTIPDVRLKVPGDTSWMRYGKIKTPPYYRYINRFIEKLGLNDNIEFCGSLSSEQMAEALSEANVFVMPSRIENHSSSLREALYVGCPCIASEVGSVHEIGIHDNNMLLYRYEESEVLAAEIIELLSNPEKAQNIAKKGYASIREKYPLNQQMVECVGLYKSMEKKNECI